MQSTMLQEKWAEFLAIEPRCQRTLEEFEEAHQKWTLPDMHQVRALVGGIEDGARDAFYDYLMIIGWPYGDHRTCPHCNERGNVEPKELPPPDDSYLWEKFTMGHADSCPWARTLGFQVFDD